MTPTTAPIRPQPHDGRHVVGRYRGRDILVRLLVSERAQHLNLPLLAARERTELDQLLRPFESRDAYLLPRGVYLRWIDRVS